MHELRAICGLDSKYQPECAMTSSQCTPGVMQMKDIVSTLWHTQRVHCAEPMRAVLLQALQTRSKLCKTGIPVMMYLTC